MKTSFLKTWGFSLTAALLFLALYVPVFIWLGNEWLDNPALSHGFLVLPIAGFIGWTKRRRLTRVNPDPAGAGILAAGLACYVIGFFLGLTWLWAFSFIITVAGMICYLTGFRGLRILAFSLALLLFMIPFPFFDSLSVLLQSFTSVSSAWLVTVFGIPVVRTGAEIALENAAFTVGLPCSGMNSLISLLALSALLLYLVDTRPWKQIVLFLLAVPVALFSNVIRVTLILVLAHFFGEETALTWFHTASSPTLFLIAVAVMLLLIRLFRCRFKSLRDIPHE